MRKKISIEQVQIGMFVCDLCGSWMDHPFWRTTFMVKTSSDLADLRASNVREVWIDTRKGGDLPKDVPAEDEDTVEHRIDQALELIEANSNTISHTYTPSKTDYQHAATVYLQSTEAVFSMFQEVRMGQSINAEQAMRVVEDISNSVMNNPDALVSLTRIKQADEYTYMHSVAVCALMMTLARQLNLATEDVYTAGMAGLLHDIGKVGIPNAILNKPGRLTEAEFEVMKTHPQMGYQTLRQHPSLSTAILDVCLHHHEKMDGTGYPNHLNNQKISLFAKMAAVCDVYDAITSNRPYKSGWNPAESLRKMAEWTPNQFDTRIFHAFVKSVGIYPTGSCVRLSPSEHLGVVVAQNGESLLKPQLKVFYSTKAHQFMTPKLIDLSHDDTPETITGREEPADWGITQQQINAIWTGLDTEHLNYSRPN